MSLYNFGKVGRVRNAGALVPVKSKRECVKKRKSCDEAIPTVSESLRCDSALCSGDTATVTAETLEGDQVEDEEGTETRNPGPLKTRWGVKAVQTVFHSLFLLHLCKRSS